MVLAIGVKGLPEALDGGRGKGLRVYAGTPSQAIEFLDQGLARVVAIVIDLEFSASMLTRIMERALDHSPDLPIVVIDGCVTARGICQSLFELGIFGPGDARARAVTTPFGCPSVDWVIDYPGAGHPQIRAGHRGSGSPKPA